MLAATKVKMSGSEKNRVSRNTNISSVKRVSRNHVLLVQNNGKEMYKKVCYTCRVVFLLIRKKCAARAILLVFFC